MKGSRNNSFWWLLGATGVMMILLALGAIYGVKPDEKTLYISEICAKNVTAAYDERSKYGADYIEIYNAGSERIDLEGYGLSDDEDEPFQFTFDKISIDPGETLIAWSDIVEGNYTYAESYKRVDVHNVPFGIKGGEKIFLTDPVGHVIDKISVPTGMPQDCVYATVKNRLGTYELCEPSPYYLEENFPTMDIFASLEEPGFSVKGGWYEEPLYLELSAEKGVIYYTLDGTEPTKDSLRYENPIKIENRSGEENLFADNTDTDYKGCSYADEPVDKITVVKAVAIDGNQRSNVTTQSYFIGFSQDEAYQGISVVSITMDPEDLFGYTEGIYVTGKSLQLYLDQTNDTEYNTAYNTTQYYKPNYAQYGRGWEREAQFEYISADRSERFIQKLGIGIHGNWSIAFNQKGFNLTAREVYDGSQSINYSFFGKTVSSIMLRAGGYRDVYSTKMRDVLNQRLMAERNVTIQEAEPCILFLNSEYWGLYNLQEQVSCDLISEVYDIPIEDIIINKNGYYKTDSDIIPPEADSYENIITFANENNLSIEENYQKVCDSIDIQSFIDYYSFEVYIANCDSIANNLAMWRSISVTDEPYRDGKWRYILYDTDDSVGMVEGMTEPSVDSFVTGHWKRNLIGENGFDLFIALLKNEEFKKQFVISFMDMVNETFDYQTVSVLLEEMANTYREADIASQGRFQLDYDEERFDEQVRIIDRFYKQRAIHITTYLKEDFDLSGILSTVEVEIEGEPADLQINTVQKENFSGKWRGKYYTDYPIILSVSRNGESLNGTWKVNGAVFEDVSSVTLNLLPRKNTIVFSE